MNKPPFQFSLAALLLTVVTVALVLGISLTPSRLGDALLIAIIICFSALCLVGIAYGDDTLRPFCLGSCVPLGMMLLYFGTHLAELFDTWWYFTAEPRQPYEVRKMMMATVVAAIALGYLGVVFRRLIEKG